MRKSARLRVEVEDVMEYFGEYVNEELAKVLIEAASGPSHFARMNMIRDILIEEGHEVIFRSGYRHKEMS